MKNDEKKLVPNARDEALKEEAVKEEALEKVTGGKDEQQIRKDQEKGRIVGREWDHWE